jgi:PhnB protein
MPSNPASIQSSIAPWLSVTDGPKAIAFYKSAFAATEVYRLDDPGGGLVVRLSVNGAEFWVSQESVSQESVSQESPEHRRQSPEPVGGDSVRMILTVANPDAVRSAYTGKSATHFRHKLPGAPPFFRVLCEREPA